MTETALKIWLGFHDIKCDFILDSLQDQSLPGYRQSYSRVAYITSSHDSILRTDYCVLLSQLLQTMTIISLLLVQQFQADLIQKQLTSH